MKILINSKPLLVAILLVLSACLLANQAFAISETKLTASDATTKDLFGRSVSISGNVALVGAYGLDSGGSSLGSAYVFRYNGTTWVQEAKLTASDAAAADEFGYSVANSVNTVVVGVRYDDDAGYDSGSAYVFRYNGSSWVEEAKLTASDAAENDSFGISVSVSGETVVVGAIGNDDNGTNSGSAYVFALADTPIVNKAMPWLLLLGY